MKCTCPKVRIGKQSYSYYCDIENHRRLAAGKLDAFSAQRREQQETAIKGSQT